MTIYKESGSVSRSLLSSDDSVLLQSYFEREGYYTIQFGLPDGLPRAAAPGNYFLPIRAHINWTTSGNTIVRELSVCDGATISGLAQAVTLTVKLIGLPARATPIVISMSPGTRPSTEPPMFHNATHYAVIPAVSAASHPIPQGIGVTSVFCTAWSGSGTSLAGLVLATQFHDTIPGMLRSVDPSVHLWAPLLPGANRLNLENLSAAEAYFSFGFGIDG